VKHISNNTYNPIVINAVSVMLISNMRAIAIGITAITKLNTMDSRTDRLCFTTCTSFSQLSFGCHKLIISPSMSVRIKYNDVTPNTKRASVTLWSIMPTSADAIRVVGRTTIRGTRSFDINIWLVARGNERKNQKFLLSKDIDTLEIHVLAIRRLITRAIKYTRSLLGMDTWSNFCRLSVPDITKKMDIATMPIGPIMVFTRYAGVVKYSFNSFLNRCLNGACAFLSLMFRLVLTYTPKFLPYMLTFNMMPIVIGISIIPTKVRMETNV